MTEIEQLEADSATLAEADNDPSTPRCVIEAFLDEPPVLAPGLPLGPLTMRGWLCMEKARSPFLTGIWPDTPERRAEALAFAVGVLRNQPFPLHDLMTVLSGHDAADAELIVANRINSAFSTALPMRWPSRTGESALSRDHGFGWWIKVLTKLVENLRMTIEQALDCPVAKAFALLATSASLAGAEPKEMNYREREAFAQEEGK